MSEFPLREKRTDVKEGETFTVGSVEMAYTIEMVIGEQQIAVKVVNFSENGLGCMCGYRVEVEEGDKCQLVSRESTLTYLVRWVRRSEHTCEFGILLEPDQ
jgi:hypothetical protein